MTHDLTRQKCPDDPFDPEHEQALVNTIRQLKERATEAEIELAAYRRAYGIPEYCNKLGCDSENTNLRCTRVLGHEGDGNAWETQEVPRLYKAWREKHGGLSR